MNTLSNIQQNSPEYKVRKTNIIVPSYPVFPYTITTAAYTISHKSLKSSAATYLFLMATYVDRDGNIDDGKHPQLAAILFCSRQRENGMRIA